MTDLYHITRILYVSVASPRAGTRTRNRVMVEEIFSAGTELESRSLVAFPPVRLSARPPV